MVDVLALIVSSISSELGVPVSTEAPAEPPDEYIIVSRYGGMQSRFGNGRLDRPIISARIIATTEARAYELACQYNDAMSRLIHHREISAVRSNALALLSSAKGEYIYQATHIVVTI